ncbi:hypothetical protein CJ030_MR6G007070 [Morella rubra]|uniref:Uncharacterized protein n=1 Tax=Morella rubra TaxID=262757 RepID=A0A6A1VC92_9ROSI|nr:hypothetical protein CJ030_MR6G007070 [Morella rubra]
MKVCGENFGAPWRMMFIMLFVLTVISLAVARPLDDLKPKIIDPSTVKVVPLRKGPIAPSAPEPGTNESNHDEVNSGIGHSPKHA